ncbi:hypothetical protein [Engelhardtia mirabilis]|uniref:Uncharacterized protein n=1 Tax=Engelhardtia mirabilis TaxID=2528011 RepID=A0A518BHY8_9BACT|nr:hypothetical protein Pla133_16510 [Planctomycetes bacterium Pla133]QDV00901.1 hypothetical protein Pla86_16500 [Planctomycetes bacterium Pla86]
MKNKILILLGAIGAVAALVELTSAPEAGPERERHSMASGTASGLLEVAIPEVAVPNFGRDDEKPSSDERGPVQLRVPKGLGD